MNAISADRVAPTPEAAHLKSRAGVPLLITTAVFVAIGYAGRQQASWFLFLFLYAFVASLLLCVRLSRFKALWFNVAAAFLALFLFEAFLNFMTFSAGAARFGTYTQGGYFSADPVKGYGAPRKEEKYTSVKSWRTGEPIYNVTYTIDRHGLRVTPANAARPGNPAWFFGCSFTLGEGVNDEETLPWLYSRRSGLKTYNFGFHGYGPHQMLRMLETGTPTEVDSHTPSVAFYNAISVHIERAAGLEPWDKDGPNYVLDGGSVRYAGHFSDGKVLQKYLDSIGERSLIYDRELRPIIFKRRDSDRERYIGIVAKSAELMRDRYGSRLVVVLWDTFHDRTETSDADSDYIEHALVERGVEVIRVSRALPRSTYKHFFIKGDAHPSAEAFGKVADLLVSEVKPTPPAGEIRAEPIRVLPGGK